ncbi:MAG: anthranilate phosphoribosyltransferase [Chloroflexi bacterium]|nr:anthranilate phosphoribosyltransferase [Chloroflexota bacterium]
MIQEALQKLTAGTALSVDEATAVAEEIMTGEATPAQIAGFLVALRMKGEGVDEITGMAKVMREKALHVHTDGEVLDVVGTGGDGMHTFNISTAASLVAAASGVPVAKHGNRAASGTVGAADILEANGVKLELTPESVRRCIDEVNIGFMFAPAFHPAMRFAGPVRRELGLRTVFNILGPLTNPAGASYQLLGVGFEGYAELMAHVLAKLGTKHTWVVRGDDGLDELTTTTTTQVWEVTGGKVRQFEVSPEDAGLGRVALSEIQATDSTSHTAMLLEALGSGSSAAKDIVMLNAAAGMVVVGRAADLRAGVALARETIDSGAPLAKLRDLAKLSQTLE